MADNGGGCGGPSSHNWLGDPDTVLACTMVMVVWKEAGFFMIFYLAALQSLPPELQEAANIEGASRWYFFRRVTFPLLMPTTLFVLVNATINSFKLVDHLFILTKGGPDNASSLLLYYIYQVAFSFFDTAYASTLTVVLLLLLAGLQTIDPALYQAARIDGASARRRFRGITLPLLRPALLVALVFRSLDAFRVFDLVYVLTGGGPGIMEATNRGAREAGGKTIGLNISLPMEQEPNPYITPELNFEFHYFFMRKLWFAYLAKALVVFTCGFGKMDEKFVLVKLARTKKDLIKVMGAL